MKDTSEVKHKPSTWARELSVVIMDWDGWRRDKKNTNVPLTRKEFMRRLVISTCKFNINKK